MKKIVIVGLMVMALVAFMTPMPAEARNLKQTPVSEDGTEGAFPVSEISAGKKRVVEPVEGAGELAEQEAAELSAEEVTAIEALGPATGNVNGEQFEAVIGWDTRQRLYTSGTGIPLSSKATALITSDLGWCTGWFAGANTVITAGHCVHSGGSGGRWASVSSVRVYPGYNAGSAPYGTKYAKQLWSVVGWTTSKDANYDYGAIKLTSPATVGSFGFTSSQATGRAALVQGYPADKYPTKSMWIGADTVRTLLTYQVLYPTDTYNGNSGGPVWYDNNGPYVYAIHTYAPYSPYTSYNRGTRITTAVFNNLIYWRNLP